MAQQSDSGAGGGIGGSVADRNLGQTPPNGMQGPPGGTAKVARLLDNKHYPWADPNSVPKVPIVPTVISQMMPPQQEKPFVNWPAVLESCPFKGAMSTVGGTRCSVHHAQSFVPAAHVLHVCRRWRGGNKMDQVPCWVWVSASSLARTR